MVDLLVDQVEFADVIVLNKLDLVEAATVARVKQLLHRLNPGAKLVEVVNSAVPVSLHRATVTDSSNPCVSSQS